MATIVNPSVDAIVERPAIKTIHAPRLISVDLLRGLVMVIMALDHVRDFFTNLTFQPEDLSKTFGALFLTRVVTHYCAPTFFLLAGTGAFLAIARGKSVGEISRFLWTRGLWLMFLELTVVAFGWGFILPLGLGGVIWALGLSMVVMALIVYLPVRWIGVLGAVMIAGHNLLDGIKPESLGKLSEVWTVLHIQGMVFIKQPTIGLFILYPLVPWLGVMMCGYALGALLLRPDRKKILFRIGVAVTLLFFVVRGINHYGNGTAGYPFSVGPWSVQSSPTLTLISFFNTLKYPPSLDYLLMTLGPSLIVLAWFDGVHAERGLARMLLVFGRVPLFFYLLHVYLIHSMAIVVAWLFHQPAAWLWQGGFFVQPPPAGYGHGLPFVYLMWILTIAILYLPCRWYMEFKRQHPERRWLSYI